MLKSIDGSKWDGGASADGKPLNKVINWQAYSAGGWMPAFIKASEGTVIDPLFKLQWAAAKGRVHRSAYHFFRPSIDVIASVNKFIEYHDGDDGEMPPVLDLEVTDGMSGDVVALRAILWLEEYERRKKKKPIIYSSPYFLRDIKAKNFTKFANYKLWLAGYPYDNLSDPVRAEQIKRVLNGQDALPTYSVPAPFKRITFQQWTAKGDPMDVPGYYTGAGSKKSVDFNFYFGSAQDLKTEFGLSSLPATDEDQTESVGKGVVWIKGRRYASDFHLFLIDTHQARAHVTNTNGKLVKVDEMARAASAPLAVNFDDWNIYGSAPYYPTNMAVSNGNIYVPHKSFVPFLNIREDGTAVISHDNFKSLFNTASGKRYLLRGGQIEATLYGTLPEFIEQHPRTAFALRQDGILMALVVDGRSTRSIGVRLHELAAVLQEFGAVIAFDADGGNSSAVALHGSHVNIPSGGGRAVVNHLLIYFEESSMSNYTVTTLRSNMSLRADHNTGADRIGSIPNANTQRGASEIWTAPADLFNNSGVQINKAGDKWAKLDTGEWIAITHLGVVYCSYVTNTPTPPPDPDPEPEPNKPALLEMNLAAGSTVVIKDADGNVIWSGTA